MITLNTKVMIYLEIKASILPNKKLEFSQSKLSFVHDIQQLEGYETFKEHHGKEYQIIIHWKTKKSLDRFMKSESYRFFHGAIIALSKSYSVRVLKNIGSVRSSILL